MAAWQHAHTHTHRFTFFVRGVGVSGVGVLVRGVKGMARNDNRKQFGVYVVSGKMIRDQMIQEIHSRHSKINTTREQ